MPMIEVRRMFHRLVLTSLLCLTACYPATKESLPGRYSVKFDWGESTLELRKDGTFTEEAITGSGTKKRIDGEWSFKDGRVSREPCVKMDHAGLDDDLWPYCSPGVNRWGPGFVEIAIDPDYGYSYQK